MPFRFRLETLLRLRLADRDQRRAELAKAQRAEDDAASRRPDGLRQEQQRNVHDLSRRLASPGAADVDRLLGVAPLRAGAEDAGPAAGRPDRASPGRGRAAAAGPGRSRPAGAGAGKAPRQAAGGPPGSRRPSASRSELDEQAIDRLYPAGGAAHESRLELARHAVCRASRSARSCRWPCSWACCGGKGP